MSEQEVGVRCGDRFAGYEDLYGRALRATRGLSELGVGAGDRVALLLRNSLEFLEASIATAPLGASAVPINWHWRGEEIAYVLRDSRAKVLVLHADLWPAIAGDVPDGLALVLVPAEHSAPSQELAEPPPGALVVARLARAERAVGAGDGDRPCEHHLHVGHHRSPEGRRAQGAHRRPARRPPRVVQRDLPARARRAHRDTRRRCTTRRPTPMSIRPCCVGVGITIMASFDAEEFLRILAEDRITVVQMVPTMFVRLLALPAGGALAL